MTRPRKHRVLLLSPLTLLLAPLSGAAQQRVEAGPDVRVSAGRSDVVQVEPVIAADPVDPDRLVVAAIALRRPHAPDWQDQQTIFVYRSTDRGASWSPGEVGALPDGWTAGDPWLLWLPSGELVLSAIAGEAITRRGDPPARARLFRSDDGGATWPVGGETPFEGGSAEDHPVLAGAGSPEAAGFYVVASHATGDDEGVDAARVAGPELEGSPVPPLRPGVEQVNLGGAAVLPGGALVVTFFSMRQPRGLWSARLDPGADRWAVTRIRESVLPVGFPSLAVDRGSSRFAGRLHAAWLESDDGADVRVLSARSDDGGATWSAPVGVHRDRGRVARTLPTVAVAPDGAVGVVWQDRRLAGGRDCSDLYGAVSVDGGATFLPETRISSETACPHPESDGAAAARFRIGGGDYQGLVATGPGAFQAVWSDSRTGRYQLWTASMEAR